MRLYVNTLYYKIITKHKKYTWDFFYKTSGLWVYVEHNLTQTSARERGSSSSFH